MKQNRDSDSARSPERMSEQPPGAAPERARTSRRRFTRAGLSASVVMTLASRSALANHCSWSAGMSGNLSRPHVAPCYGKTPGFWKNWPDQWQAAGYEPGLCNPITYKNGQCKDYDFVTFGQLEAAKDTIPAPMYSAYKSWANFVDTVTPQEALPAPTVPPTTLGTAFGSSLPLTNPDQTMMQALWDPPQAVEPSTLVAHACAALLNVGRYGEESFGYTKAGLLDFIGNWSGSYEALKNALESLNSREGW